MHHAVERHRRRPRLAGQHRRLGRGRPGRRRGRGRGHARAAVRPQEAGARGRTDPGTVDAWRALPADPPDAASGRGSWPTTPRGTWSRCTASMRCCSPTTGCRTPRSRRCSSSGPLTSFLRRGPVGRLGRHRRPPSPAGRCSGRVRRRVRLVAAAGRRSPGSRSGSCCGACPASLMSGTFESLLYDELSARGEEGDYAGLVGLAESAALRGPASWPPALAVPLLHVGRLRARRLDVGGPRRRADRARRDAPGVAGGPPAERRRRRRPDRAGARPLPGDAAGRGAGGEPVGAGAPGGPDRRGAGRASRRTTSTSRSSPPSTTCPLEQVPIADRADRGRPRPSARPWPDAPSRLGRRALGAIVLAGGRADLGRAPW